MKDFFGRAISHTHGAASQLPKRPIFTPRDLEVVEKSRGIRRLSLIQSRSEQTGKACPLPPEKFAADRTGISRSWSHGSGRATCRLELATARAALHPLPFRCRPFVSLRLEAARGSAPATG